MKKKCVNALYTAVLLAFFIIAGSFVSLQIAHADSDVYITATGVKYHFSSDCWGLRNANSLTTVSLSYAQSHGYTACAVCAGGTSDSSGTGSVDMSSQLMTSSSAIFAPAVKEIYGLPSVKITKLVPAKKAVTVKWKKVSKKNQKKIQGIEIQVSTDPAFTNIVKSITAGKKKTSKKIKGLKSKTKYWVRIRAYKNATDGKHVSVWKKKTVKVK